MPLSSILKREEWEREDIFMFFTRLFQMRKVEPKVKQDWTVAALYDAVENGTVREVMEIAIPLYLIFDEMITYDSNITAVGIDLGTSNCYMAVNRRNGIEVAAIDNTGERCLPSFVSFDEENEKCGKVVHTRFENFAKNTVFDVKRIIGRSYPDVPKDSTWPFEVVLEEKSVKIQLLNHLGHKISKSPEEISAVLLRHIKQKAEEYQGKVLTSAVVAIPATFTENQKIATIEAGKLAGWESVDLIPEPIAASVAYFIDNPLPNNATILLFDLGGGTLDICIFEIKDREFRLIESVGDSNLGGRNFDKVLYKYFKNKLLTEHDVNVGRNDRKKYQLLVKCQDIKHNLTVGNEDLIIVDDYDKTKDETKIQITRQQFENQSINLLKTIENLIQFVVTDLLKSIDRIILVGGSSRMPMIKSLLKNIFPNAEQSCLQHPEEAVALGAAYYAYYFEHKKRKSNKNLNQRVTAVV